MPGTVTVACKLPTGLVMQLYQMQDVDEPLMAGGYRTVKRAFPETKPGFSQSVKLNGSARRVGRDSPHEIRNGVGLTFGVDADFFNEWMKRNADADFVRKGLIFAQTKTTEVDAQARDQQSLKTGMEPIDPKNLPAEFKNKIETAPKT